MNDQSKNVLEKACIIDVVNQLFISTDNRDWAKVKTCFTNDVLFDMTSLTGGEPVTMTAQQIVEGWDNGLKALKAIHHQAGNYVVNLQNNEAEVFCCGIALHYLPNPTNRNTRTFVGSYNFHLTKTGNSWRIGRFKFNLKSFCFFGERLPNNMSCRRHLFQHKHRAQYGKDPSRMTPQCCCSPN